MTEFKKEIDKKAFFTISYGVYIISSINDKGEYNGQIANSIFQVTSEPPTIAISINKQNLTHNFISLSKVFSISVLTTDVPMTFIGKFGFKSGRNLNKFENVNFKINQTKSPLILENTNSIFETKLIDKIDCLTHTIFIGEIIYSKKLNDKQSLTYNDYHLIKGGKSPKTAPTYINNNEIK